jgi:hypothetical protein
VFLIDNCIFKSWKSLVWKLRSDLAWRISRDIVERHRFGSKK